MNHNIDQAHEYRNVVHEYILHFIPAKNGQNLGFLFVYPKLISGNKKQMTSHYFLGCKADGTPSKNGDKFAKIGKKRRFCFVFYFS